MHDTPPQPQLVLFPGLGGDHHYYHLQQSVPARLITPDWLEPESDRETLAHYAERMAAGIRPEGTFYIGGVSLGAMVALEASHHLKTAGVLMISGCRAYSDLSLLFKMICPAAAAMPRQWVRPVLRFAGPPGFASMERLSPPQIAVMMNMMLRHSPRQLRWSVDAMMHWEFQGKTTNPVHCIHGEIDEVIPISHVNPDEVVKGGRHLINLTHAPQVNAFLAKCMGLGQI